MTENIWYDIGKILSFNKKYNFVDGIRGRGKTYAFKKFAVNQFIKHKKKTVWLRFNETQKRDARNNFLRDLLPNEPELFENHTFETRGDTLFIDDEEAIVFRSITRASKSKSVVYDENFKYVIYDEYITEYTATEDLLKVMIVIETIERMRDDVKHFYLGNAITRNNPHYEIHGIKLKDLREKEYVTGKMYCVHSDFYNEEFKEVKKDTQSGKMQMQQGYGEHSIEGKYLLDDYTNVTGAKNRKKKLLFIIDDVAIWQSHDTNKVELIWCSNLVIDESFPVKFTTGETRRNYKNVREFGSIFNIINYHAFKGTLYFHTLQAQSKIKELM